MIANADQLAYWNDVAGPKWVTNQARLDRLMAPLADVLIAAAAPRPGESVLDVGCGCGDLALRIAADLGVGGRVRGIDLSEPMLAHARSRAALAKGGADLEWSVADAMTYAFDPTIDLLVSRFGVMFFDDRPRAFANLRRALKPNGRFAFLAWRSRAEVQWMQAPLDWLAPILPLPDDMDGAIGPFGLADAAATSAMLSSVGFSAVEARAVEQSLLIGTSIDEAWSMLSDTGPAAAAMRDMDQTFRREAQNLIRAGLQSHLADDGVKLGGACWLYTGRT